MRRLGFGETRRLEPALRPALEAQGVQWALISKGGRPRLSCRVPRGVLPALLATLAAEGFLFSSEALLQVDREVEALGHVFVSVDPGVQDAVALDYERVSSVPEVAGARYAKWRPTGWTAYWPLGERLPAEELDRLCRTPEPDPAAHYDERAHEVVAALGHTYQAGRMRGTRTAEDSNRALGVRAGIVDGERVLDAGCGAGGPALDLCAAWPGLQVDGVTLSAEQARLARAEAVRRGVDRARFHVADLHALPFEDGAFDRVLALESLGYSTDPDRLFRELLRVLRPGGVLYAKDVFRRPGALSPAERLELAEFDAVFGQRTPTLEAMAAAMHRAGFTDLRAGPLQELTEVRSFWAAMQTPAGELNDFGRRHYRVFQALPVGFAEVSARRPLGPG